MPELPEVETAVRELRANVLGERVKDFWTDAPNIIKRPSLSLFRKEVIGKEIKKVRRKGKYIIFDLSNSFVLLVHQKMTGHFLLGKWKREKGRWIPLPGQPAMEDPYNRFIHLIFFLYSGKMLAFSDLRKFAKFELWKKKDLLKGSELDAIGINPLSRDFSLEKLKEVMAKRKSGKIKVVLMDQSLIAGIGNIYSNEILWEARVSPFREIKTLTNKDWKAIYLATKKILSQAIKVKGESFSDYRDIYGQKGGFDPFLKVYKRAGQPCFRCGAIIKAAKIGGRTAYYCPRCQK